jgi:hypothetical protein
MGVKRRYFVGGASALAVSPGSSAAFAENRDPVRGPTLISAAADPADFEAALRPKFSTGDVLNWRGGNARSPNDPQSGRHGRMLLGTTRG